MKRRMLIGLSGIILMVLLSSCAGPQKKNAVIEESYVKVSGELQKDFKRALELLKDKQYQQAAELFRSITEQQPSVAGPFVNLGIAYTELGEFTDAEKALLNALKVNSRHVVANNRLGLLYRRMGKFDDARLSYERALNVDPEYALAHLNLGILCDIYIQDLQCALQHFERYLALKPEDDKQVAAWLVDLKRRVPVNTNNSQSKNNGDGAGQ